MGYLMGGIIPLIPYFFISRAHTALLYSSILTGVVLLVFGVVLFVICVIFVALGS